MDFGVAYETWPRVPFEGREWEGLPVEEAQRRAWNLARSCWGAKRILVILWSDGGRTVCLPPTIH